MSRALPPLFDPVTIRDNAARALSYSSEHNCRRVHLMREEDIRGLLEDLAVLAEVKLRFTKTEPAYVESNRDAGDSHVKCRTSFGWFHTHGKVTDKGDDHEALFSLLSSLCNGYWVIY